MNRLLSLADRRLLNLMQSEFPLVAKPFSRLGDMMGMEEEEVLSSATRLKGAGFFRAIHGVFDAARLGYRSTLVAVQVIPEGLDTLAESLNAHPGVSHNYLRRHRFNLWFTLTLPASEPMGETIEHLLASPSVKVYRELPAIRLFKIGVHFDMVEEVAAVPSPGEWTWETSSVNTSSETLGHRDRLAVGLLGEDLPLTPAPFSRLTDATDISVTELLERAVSLRRAGVMRRYGALLRHRRAGFGANGMSCWVVPEGDLPRVGELFSHVPAVSHCYQRSTYPDWPYSLFAMVHGHNEQEVLVIVADMAAAAGVVDYEVLFSERELKKESVSYFHDESVR